MTHDPTEPERQPGADPTPSQSGLGEISPDQPGCQAACAAATKPSPRWQYLALATILSGAILVAGSPQLGAPWILGDEFIFIVDNPDVNPAADPTAATPALPRRLARIFTKVHDDLYQPLPILTYAIEWALAGGQAKSFRRTDLVLHLINALLVWAVLRRLLARTAWAAAVSPTAVAWCLALLWGLHPMHVTAYAADMGRTHLLSATFGLLALYLHLQSLLPAQGRYFTVAAGMLVLAMVSKPLPGWVALVFVLEADGRGWRAAARSPRVWTVAAVCVFFALLTLATSARAGLTEDAAEGLFGDPLARSALATWMYFRNLVAPLWLSYWQLPDPRTGWHYWRVWLGLLVGLASVFHAGWSWRRPATRPITIGWTWCWAVLLPMLGVVGARESSASDRYLYHPSIAIMFILGTTLMRALSRLKVADPARAARPLFPLTAALAVIMLLWTLPHCWVTRSVIARARRLVELNPGDPRALQALAAAYDFARNHQLTPGDLQIKPPDLDQFTYFNDLFRQTLTRAATVKNLEWYFPDPADRGPFHRQLAYRYLTAGDPEQSLVQARLAQQFQPDEFNTWKRLAHAYQALGRYEEAAQAYARCEELLPDNPLTQAVHFTDFGCLLLFELERDADACPKFVAALQTGRPLPLAKLGMALCEIRYGQGARGFQLVSEVLAADPTNVQAALVLAEYHLRSHHWQQAAMVYDALLRDDPTNYAALRGFHEVCLQVGQYDQAVTAWLEAFQRDPGRRELRSWLVWASALAARESASAAAQELLSSDPGNPLACLALMLDAVRTGRPAEAVEWIRQARAGQPIPKGREFERAAAVLKLLGDRGELPPEAMVARAAVYMYSGTAERTVEEAGQLLGAYLGGHPDGPGAELARRLQRELSDLGVGR